MGESMREAQPLLDAGVIIDIEVPLEGQNTKEILHEIEEIGEELSHEDES